jgi:hypothetical protein
LLDADEAYYRGGVIKCRDGSGKFTRDQLNDDFCDCPDGTDEPGTASFLSLKSMFFLACGDDFSEISVEPCSLS